VNWIYLQNHLVPADEAKISVLDGGFLYGEGLFETVRAYGGRIFRLADHLKRLQRGSTRLGITLPPLSDIEKALYDTLEKNNLTDAILRCTVTSGGREIFHAMPSGPPTLVIVPRPLDFGTLHETGVSAVIVPFQIYYPGNRPLKSTSFLHHVFAKRDAMARGTFEGIFLSHDAQQKRYLAEGATSNLFWIRHGTIATPSLETGILDGITRSAILGQACERSIPTTEGFFEVDNLYQADEAFLTNTGFELMPLVNVDGHCIGTGRPGPMTQMLHRAFKEAV